MEREEELHRFQAYLQRRFPERRTSQDYVSDIRQFMGGCAKEWRDVNLHDIDAFIDQQRQSGLKPATIKRRAAALKTFFDFLAEESGELGWANPVRMKRHAGKQPHRLPRDLSDEVIQRLWAVIATRRDQAWFSLMLRAGLRVGEVVSLQLADVLSPATENQPARLRVCGKGRKERIVLLTADAYAVLQSWLAERPPSPHPWIFLNERDGGPLSVSGIEFRLTAYAHPIGLSVSPHQLRHTYARQLTEAGMPVTSLSKLLGHAQVSTTQLYTAGADPSLAQAYQQAMSHLAQAPLPPPAPPSSPPLPPAPVDEPPPDPRRMDCTAWAPHLPVTIRQACLAFVQRRFPTWKARRRVEQANRVLGELRRFWDWQMTVRPIAQPGQLELRDLHTYQERENAPSARTVDHELGYVVSLLRELAEQGQPVEASVFRWRPRPRPDSLPRALSESEARRFEDLLTQRLDSPDPLTRLENACFLLLAHTGLRAGECLDLSRQDLDLDNQRLVIRQGKGQRDRAVYFTALAQQALQRYLTYQPRPLQAPLFVLPNARPFSYMWLYEHALALGARVGIDQLTPHRLRHTLATRLLNGGMEITRIQKLLGHEYVTTTTIYARVYDHTVEADYRRAMHSIELAQMPLSDQPIRWDTIPQTHEAIANVPLPIDNSV
jgi:site-specific recombinase XerD